MGRADTYSQPDAADPVLPDDLVLGLARAHLSPPDRVGAVLAVDESGGEARAYLLDGGVVVKTQRAHRLRPRTSLAKEAALLAALEPTLPGRVPTLFGYDRVDTGAGQVELLVMSRVAGNAVVTQPTGLAGPARAQVLRELAAVLRTFHALDPTGLVTAGLLPVDGDAAGLRRRVELGLSDLVEHFDSHADSWPLTVPPSQVAAAALDALPRRLEQPPVALHSNPGPTHVFVDDGRVFTGLIDFGDSYASHPALDLRTWPDPADRLVLRECYLDGRLAGTEWDAVWTVAMLQADLAVLADRRTELVDAAAADLTARLAQL